MHVLFSQEILHAGTVKGLKQKSFNRNWEEEVVGGGGRTDTRREKGGGGVERGGGGKKKGE